MSLYLGNNLISGVGTPIEGARNIGQIITSTIPLSDAGLHLLDGALINGSGSYADFVTYISGLVSAYPDLFETEANWQTSVTNYGVCGKFVYDSVNNTVRLPKITGFIEGTTDLTALGDLIEAGLPNITGETGAGFRNYGNVQNGALYGTNYVSNAPANSNYGSYSNLNFDASQSNSIYGNSTTVQPQAIKVLYYIVLATSVKTQIEVDIDEIATDLNGKADIDLANCTKPHIVETYHSGNSWYRVYSDGWCEQGGVSPASGTATIDLIKEYKDTNYQIFSSGKNLNNNGAVYCFQVRTINTDSFTYYQTYSSSSSTGQSGSSWFWKTCGYIS